MLEPMQSHGFDVVVADLSHPTAAHVRELLRTVEVVVVDVTVAGDNALAGLHNLYTSTVMSDVVPRLLCFSTAHRNAKFVLNVQNTGARYVSIHGVPMLLLEAIELVLAEMEELQKDRLSFTILRGFALDGDWRQGESVEGVLFPRAGSDPQLRLGWTERLAFDLLARHPRLSFDARQIATALNGLRQAKIRVPSVKMSINRIRRAMASKFCEADLQVDPSDVLKSFFATGTNRVLYKLHADCKVVYSASVGRL